MVLVTEMMLKLQKKIFFYAKIKTCTNSFTIKFYCNKLLHRQSIYNAFRCVIKHPDTTLIQIFEDDATITKFTKLQYVLSFFTFLYILKQYQN